MKATDLLSTLPDSWQTVPIKAVCYYTVSNVDKHSLEDEMPVCLCNYTDVYKNDRVSPVLEWMAATATEGEIEKFHLEVGDVVITKDSESWDDTFVFDFVNDPDEIQEAFRNLYSFLSQVIPYQDSDLEKLFTYLRHLALKLPKRKAGPGYQFDEEVELDYYRLQKISEGSINWVA